MNTSGRARGAERTVWIFFYGSFMNAEVLAGVGIAPERFDPARLLGYELNIAPLANLVRAEGACAFGVLAEATHAELERLYGQDWVAGIYLPEPVLVETVEGVWRPALCYVAPSMEPAGAADDYVERIAAPARAFGFPSWYLERIESFRPDGGRR